MLNLNISTNINSIPYVSTMRQNKIESVITEIVKKYNTNISINEIFKAYNLNPSILEYEYIKNEVERKIKLL